MKKTIYILSLLSFLIVSGNLHAFSTKAKSAFLIDYDSGAELIVKNVDELMPPSSMVKMMTVMLIFDALKDGTLAMDDLLDVSENADYKNPTWYPASKVCLAKGQKISVRNTLLGLIVLSGGDASVVAAEKLAGSESAFTVMMQKKARSIGMKQSTFGNASGLPDPNNLMTSRELAILGSRLISDYPDLYPMFETKRFEFDDHKTEWCQEWGRTHVLNYNRLLFTMPGADGLKTGHTKEGGYGMVASANVGGRRLIAVLNGLDTKNHNGLAAEMKKLLDHGYSTTMNKRFYQAGDEIVKVPVWYGRKSFVIATTERNFAATLKRNQPTTGLRVIAKYNGPVPAPIKKGDVIGEIIAELDGKIVARAPLIANERVTKTQFFGRVLKNISVIFTGK